MPTSESNRSRYRGYDPRDDEAGDTNGTWSRKKEGRGREAQPMHVILRGT